MISLLRSDVYRLLRDKSFWVCLVLAAFFSLSLTLIGSLTLAMQDQSLVDDVMNQLRGGVALENLQGGEMVVGLVMMGYGSFLTMMSTAVAMPFVPFFATLVIVLHLSSDFETGFIKNIFCSRQMRKIYYGEKILFILLICLVFLVVTMAVTVGYRAIIGAFYSGLESPLELATWFIAWWLTFSVYGLICATIYWLSRSKALGIISTLLISTGLLLSIISGVFSGLIGADLMTAISHWVPSGVVTLLTQWPGNLWNANNGLAPALQILFTLALWYLVLLVITFSAIRRKDL